MQITRRSALLGTAAAVSFAAPVAMAGYLNQSADDARLEHLAAQQQHIFAEWMEALDAQAKTEKVYFANRPERPPELFKHILGAGDVWREEPLSREDIEQYANGMRAWQGEKRRQKIDEHERKSLRALDAYEVRCKAVEYECGATAAKLHSNALLGKLSDCQDEARGLRATTLRGLFAKCRAVLDPVQWEELQKDVREENEYLTDHEHLLWSLWRDLERQVGRPS